MFTLWLLSLIPITYVYYAFVGYYASGNDTIRGHLNSQALILIIFVIVNIGNLLLFSPTLSHDFDNWEIMAAGIMSFYSIVLALIFGGVLFIFSRLRKYHLNPETNKRRKHAMRMGIATTLVEIIIIISVIRSF